MTLVGAQTAEVPGLRYNSPTNPQIPFTSGQAWSTEKAACSFYFGKAVAWSVMLQHVTESMPVSAWKRGVQSPKYLIQLIHGPILKAWVQKLCLLLDAEKASLDATFHAGVAGGVFQREDGNSVGASWSVHTLARMKMLPKWRFMVLERSSWRAHTNHRFSWQSLSHWVAKALGGAHTMCFVFTLRFLTPSTNLLGDLREQALVVQDWVVIYTKECLEQAGLWAKWK